MQSFNEVCEYIKEKGFYCNEWWGPPHWRRWRLFINNGVFYDADMEDFGSFILVSRYSNIQKRKHSKILDIFRWEKEDLIPEWVIKELLSLESFKIKVIRR